MKTNKSYTKRLRLTGTGKLMARKPGQNHYNAKESGSVGTQKRQTRDITTLSNKKRGQFLPRSPKRI